MVEISFKDRAAFNFEATLEEVPYILSFNWNSSHEFWSLNIYSREQELLISGLKIVNKAPMTNMFPGRDLPPGEFFAIAEDVTNSNRIEKDDFINGIFHFIYFTSEEYNDPFEFPNLLEYGTVPLPPV